MVYSRVEQSMVWYSRVVEDCIVELGRVEQSREE